MMMVGQCAGLCLSAWSRMSMAPASIPMVKDAIRKTTLAQVQALAAAVLAAHTSAEIVSLCRKLLAQVAPELLPLV